MKILILEDDPALLFALSQVLEEGGHKVYATNSIASATYALEKNAPDILLLDLVIGNDVSIEIADLAGYRLPNAEVIYLTGSKRFPNGELLGLSRNASWILRKPIDFFELQAMISHIERTLAAKDIEPVSQVWPVKSAR